MNVWTGLQSDSSFGSLTSKDEGKIKKLDKPRSVIRKKFPHKTPARKGSKIEL